jgi:hypothetical protein
MKTVTMISALLLLLSGCSSDSIFEGISDDNTRDAVIEEAALALDDQDYAGAVSLLAELYTTTSPDPRVSSLLSSAYMGKAGVDFVGLIEYAGQQDRESFDMVSHSLSLFPAPERTKDNESRCNAQTRDVLVRLDEGGDYEGALAVDGACVGSLIDDLETAQYILDVLLRSGRYSDDDEIQLGLASAAHFVYLLGEKVGTALNRTLVLDEELRIPGLVPAPINRKAYQYYAEEQLSSERYRWDSLVEGDFAVETAGPGSLSPYQRDLLDVLAAVRAFDRAAEGPSDVRDALAEFLDFALMMPTTGIDEDAITSVMTTSGVYSLVNGIAVQ